jgi:hypothetical protein
LARDFSQLEELRTQKIENAWLTARLMSRIKKINKYGQGAMQEAADYAGLSMCQARKYALAWECLKSNSPDDQLRMIPHGPNKIYTKHVRGRRKKGTKSVPMDGKDFQREEQRDDENHRYNPVKAS